MAAFREGRSALVCCPLLASLVIARYSMMSLMHIMHVPYAVTIPGLMCLRACVNACCSSPPTVDKAFLARTQFLACCHTAELSWAVVCEAIA